MELGLADALVRMEFGLPFRVRNWAPRHHCVGVKSGENHNYSFLSPEPSLNIIDLKPGQNGPKVLWSLARSSHLDALTPFSLFPPPYT